MTTMEAEIVGMHCGKCARQVEGELEEIDGIKDVQANHETDIAIVEFEAGKVDEDALRRKLDSMHYTVTDLRPQ